MRNNQFFSQADCAVVIDGQLAEDFSDGDAIRVNPSTEGSSIERGLDVATTTFASDRSGTFEIDVKGTSVTLDQVNALWNAQLNGAARLVDIQVMTSAREPIRLEGCSISSPGAIATGGRTSSPRTVIFNVQRITLPQ